MAGKDVKSAGKWLKMIGTLSARDLMYVQQIKRQTTNEVETLPQPAMQTCLPQGFP
jgi:hypothetical protein